jgi:hypothetical protein
MLPIVASPDFVGTSRKPSASLYRPVMAPRIKEGEIIASFNGKWVAWSHTIVAYGMEYLHRERKGNLIQL